MATEPIEPRLDATALDQSTEASTTALYRAAIGPVGEAHYLPRFLRFEELDRAGVQWNTAAALNTLNWLVFRQLWLPALTYVGSIIGLTLLVFGIGRLVFQFSEATEWAALGLLAALAVVLPGLFGTALFYKECRKRMAAALAANATVSDACAALAKQASSRQRMGAIAAVNVLLAALLAFTYFNAPKPGKLLDEMHASAVSGGKLAAASAPASASVSAAVSASAPAPVSAASANASAPAVPASTPASATLASSAPASAVSAAASSSPIAAPASAPASAPALASSRAVAGVVQADNKPGELLAKPASAPAAPTSAAGPATKSASSPPVAKPNTAPASTPAATTASLPKTKAPAASTSAPAPAPTPAVAASKPASKPASKASVATTSPVAPPTHNPTLAAGFYINVGLFAEESNAKNAHTKLLDAGLTAFVQELKTAKGKRTRVRVGPFDTEAQAESAATKIRGLQLEAVVFQQ